ncbi:MAG: hypothetical protein IJM33_06200 [Bacteroidales bacterium]|nr:hypothetical protein [Bacteroidales bacterium]
MERIVIQKDNVNLMPVDAFIRGICDECHIDNYYAMISVAVTKSIEVALSSKANAGSDDNVLIDFAYSPFGILFTIVNSTGCFNIGNESMELPSMLADKVVVSDNKSRVQLFFSVRGIDAAEASRRVAVLNQFYKVASTEKVYA